MAAPQYLDFPLPRRGWLTYYSLPKIYQGLNGAPEEYKKFARQVFDINSILGMLNETTSHTQLLPSDSEQLTHLVQGCHAILLRLQKVIDKYEGVGKRRFSRTIGFVGEALADNTELPQTLNTQLALLTSFQVWLARYVLPS